MARRVTYVVPPNDSKAFSPYDRETRTWLLKEIAYAYSDGKFAAAVEMSKMLAWLHGNEWVFHADYVSNPEDE